jgi:hypothetical protein
MEGAGLLAAGEAAGLAAGAVLPGLGGADWLAAGAEAAVLSFFNPSLSRICVNRLMGLPFKGLLL